MSLRTLTVNMDDLQSRQLAAEVGLAELSPSARWKAWRQLLLGATALTSAKATIQACPSGDLSKEHGVSHQYIIDSDRALHFDICAGWSDAKRADSSRCLAWLLHSAFSANHSDSRRSPSYFQGCHEVASVLLLQAQAAGSSEAGLPDQVHALQALLNSRLEGFAAPTMETASKSLDAVSRLLEIVDPRLHRAVAGSEMALLSWVICMGAHDLRSWANVTRLFDLYIAGHPLLPIYTAVALLHLHRDAILAEAAKPDAVLFVTLRGLPSRLRGEQRPAHAKGSSGSASSDGSPSADSASPAAAPSSASSAASASSLPFSRGRGSVSASQAAHAAQAAAAVARRQESLQEVINRGSAGSVTVDQVAALASGLCRAVPPPLLLCTGPRDILHRFGRDWPSSLGEGAAAPWGSLAHEGVTTMTKPLTDGAVADALAAGKQPLSDKTDSALGKAGAAAQGKGAVSTGHGTHERSRQRLWISTLLLGLAGVAVVLSVLIKSNPLPPACIDPEQGIIARACSVVRHVVGLLRVPMTVAPAASGGTSHQ